MCYDKQEVIGYMKSEWARNRPRYSDPYELAEAAADMFDLWEEESGKESLPDWMHGAAEDVYHGSW